MHAGCLGDVIYLFCITLLLHVETLLYIGRLDPTLVGISSGFHSDSSHSLGDFNLQCARIDHYYSYFMKCSYCSLDVVLVVFLD